MSADEEKDKFKKAASSREKRNRKKKEFKNECPKCHSSNLTEILYGMPGTKDPNFWAKVESGEIVLGGCVIREYNPTHHCRDCHHEFAVKGHKE
jgi:hypothetical protein